MPLLNKLVYTNQDYLNTVASIETQESYIEQYKTRLSNTETAQREYSEVSEELDDFLYKLTFESDLIPPMDMIIAFDRQQRQARSDVRSSEQRVIQDTQRLSTAYDQLSQLKEKEQRLRPKAYVSLSKKDVQNNLKDIKSIVQDSICIGTYANGKAFIRFRYEGLAFSPNVNEYEAINRGRNVTIPLLPIQCELTLGDNNVKLSAPRGIESQIDGYSGNNTMHPHILSGNIPCLGDFGGPVIEAAQDLDFKTFATLIELFLSQAAADDPAGATWYRWVLGPDWLNRVVRDAHYVDDVRVFYFYLRADNDILVGFDWDDEHKKFVNFTYSRDDRENLLTLNKEHDVVTDAA